MEIFSKGSLANSPFPTSKYLTEVSLKTGKFTKMKKIQMLSIAASVLFVLPIHVVLAKVFPSFDCAKATTEDVLPASNSYLSEEMQLLVKKRMLFV